MYTKKLLLIFLCIIFFSLILVGCGSPYISGALLVHPESADEPEIQLNNPVGEVEAGIEQGKWSIFVRHQSGITQNEYGYGFNCAGIRLTLGGENE